MNIREFIKTTLADFYAKTFGKLESSEIAPFSDDEYSGIIRQLDSGTPAAESVEAIYIDTFEGNISSLAEDWGYDADSFLGNLIDDCRNSGCSQYKANEYKPAGETLEYEGETYSVWQHTDDGYDSKHGYLMVLYGLMPMSFTADYLQGISLEADSTNRVCPFIAFLNEDKEKTYPEALTESEFNDAFTLICIKPKE